MNGSGSARRLIGELGLACRALGGHRAIWSNASLLFGATIAGGLLGFLFWWLAARLFPPWAVGYASTATSAMVMLGNIGTLGIGTVLIGELAKRSRSAGTVVAAALGAAVLASSVLGLSVALLAPHLIPGLTPGPQIVALFVVGVGLTGAAFVLDAAFIGMLSGTVQLSRNVIFHVVKLVLLYLVGVWWYQELSAGIVAAWVLGIAGSIAWVAVSPRRRKVPILRRPDWAFLRRLPRVASAHNWLNLALEAPQFTMPIVATALVSATAGASFYAAWMIVSFAYVLPFHLGTVLYAVGAGDAEALRRKFRFTFTVSGSAGLIGIPALLLVAPLGLRLFGPSYVEQGTLPLQLLALGYFPMIVWAHFVALCRIRDWIGYATMTVVAGTALEIGAAVTGALRGGLVGLAIGLLAAKWVEGAIAAPSLRAALRGTPSHLADQGTRLQPVAERRQ